MIKRYAKKELYDKDIKIEIMEKCLAYLVHKGFDNASIKNLCKETGISSGSIYYWFKDKDEVILETAEHCLNIVSERLYKYVCKNTQDAEETMNNFPDELMKYKDEFRFIYQVTMSKQYGDKMRLVAGRFYSTYDSFSMKLAEKMNCSSELCLPFIYLFISAALDYIVWEDRAKLTKELDAICRAIHMIAKS